MWDGRAFARLRRVTHRDSCCKKRSLRLHDRFVSRAKSITFVIADKVFKDFEPHRAGLAAGAAIFMDADRVVVPFVKSPSRRFWSDAVIAHDCIAFFGRCFDRDRFHFGVWLEFL